MFWDALLLIVPAYFLVTIMTTALDGMQYYLDHGRQRTRSAYLAVFHYSWRGFRVHLIVVISLLLFAVSMTHLWESEGSTRWYSADHYRESNIYAEEVMKIYDFYGGELTSDYGDAATIRHLLDQALVHSGHVQVFGAEQLSERQSSRAYERMLVYGLWDMYGGIIESDTGRYQSGALLLREWHVWLDDKRPAESDIIQGTF